VYPDSNCLEVVWFAFVARQAYLVYVEKILVLIKVFFVCLLSRGAELLPDCWCIHRGDRRVVLNFREGGFDRHRHALNRHR
jgi:hypothetical protein